MGKYKSVTQDKIFLEFMTDHPDLARVFCKGDKVAQDELWAQLANKLNGEGPPLNDVAGWKKAWIDWKGNNCRKLAHNKTKAHATGGGSFNQFVISPVEEQIAIICGLYRTVDGIPNSKSFGVQDTNKETEKNVSESSSSSPSPALSPTPTKRKQEDGLQKFMEKESQHLGAIRYELEKMSANSKTDELSKKLEIIDSKLDIIIGIKKEQLEEFKKDRQERKRHNKEVEKHNSLMLKNSLEKVKLKLQTVELEKMKLSFNNKFTFKVKK